MQFKKYVLKANIRTQIFFPTPLQFYFLTAFPFPFSYWISFSISLSSA